MTFHDLGTLGTADVVAKKRLIVKINMPWDRFSLVYAALLADLSTGSIAVLQEAVISKKDVKIKKEGDELDWFFTKVESAQKKSSYGFDKEERRETAEAVKFKGHPKDKDATGKGGTTYDESTGRPEGKIILKDGNMEGILVPIIIEEQIKSHLTHTGEKAEDEVISGVFKIQNPSKRDRIWDIDIQLRDIRSTSLDDEQLSFKELEPEQDTQQEYTISAEKYQKYLEVTEFVSTLNDSNTESYALKVGEDNPVYFKITIKNVSDTKLTEIQVKKRISEGLSNVEVIGASVGEPKLEGGELLWILEHLEGAAEATLELRMIARIADIDTRIKSGTINVSYKIPTSISGMGIAKFDAYTNNRFFIECGEQEKPDTYDCQLIFQNTSEFMIRLVNVDVYDPKDEGKKFVDIDPMEIPPMPDGAEWVSKKWISPLYDNEMFGRWKFRKGKEIKALSGEGNYEITLFVENTGDPPLRWIRVIDLVPDAFQYTDFKPAEPEIVDIDGQNMLLWKLEVIEPGKGWSVTYKISGQGEYAASEAQFSPDWPFRTKCEFFVVADHQISTKGIIDIDEVALAVASFEGELLYNIKQLASFRETTFNVTHKVTNSGGDVLNELFFQEALQKFFVPPKKDEIIVKLTREGKKEQIEFSAKAISIEPADQEPGEEHTVKLAFNDLIKNEAVGGFRPGDVMTVTYPITSMKPDAQIVFKSDVLYQANTLPAGRPLEARPGVIEIAVAHIRRQFRKGKAIKPLSGEGNYEITLFVENTGQFNLEGMTVIDKVPYAFQYKDFNPTEPEIVDIDGENALSWKIEVLEPGKDWSVTYVVTATVPTNAFTDQENSRIIYDVKENEEKPDTFVCQVAIQNLGEYSVQISTFEAYYKHHPEWGENGRRLYAKISSNDNLVLPANAKWTSTEWEYTTPEPNTDPTWNFETEFSLVPLDTPEYKLWKKRAEGLQKQRDLEFKTKLMEDGIKAKNSKQYQDAIKYATDVLAICHKWEDVKGIATAQQLLQDIEAAKKEDKIKEEQRRQRSEENTQIVHQAKSAFERQDWDESIRLFNNSVSICEQEGWTDGVRYGREKIGDAQKRKARVEEDKRTKAEAEKNRLELANQARQKQQEEEQKKRTAEEAEAQRVQEVAPNEFKSICKQVLVPLHCPDCGAIIRELSPDAAFYKCPYCKVQSISPVVFNTRGKMSAGKLTRLSRMQVARATMASRGDIQFNPALFVPRGDADLAFKEFLGNGVAFEKRLFLLLGEAGFGKTWIAAHWALELAAQGYVTFYLTVRDGVEFFFSQVFQESTHSAIASLEGSAGLIDKPIVWFFDGYDECDSDDERRKILIHCLRAFTRPFSEKFQSLMIITSRAFDWTDEKGIAFDQREAIQKALWTKDPAAGDQASFWLHSYTSGETTLACEKYHLPPTTSWPETLRSYAPFPLWIRFIAEWKSRTKAETLPQGTEIGFFEAFFKRMKLTDNHLAALAEISFLLFRNASSTARQKGDLLPEKLSIRHLDKAHISYEVVRHLNSCGILLFDSDLRGSRVGLSNPHFGYFGIAYKIHVLIDTGESAGAKSLVKQIRESALYPIILEFARQLVPDPQSLYEVLDAP